MIVEKIEDGGCNKDTSNPDQYLPRDQLKITLKIFPQEASVGELEAGVSAALTKLSTNRCEQRRIFVCSFHYFRVDTLFIATPPDIYPHVGIGSGGASSGAEQEEPRQQMEGLSVEDNCVITTHSAELWAAVERLITEGKVGGAGLSDLNPPVFFSIYEQASIKPTSIQVRYSCALS